MAGRAGVAGGVAGGGVVAAADVAACEAQAEMHPLTADLQAVLATARTRMDAGYLVQMRAPASAPRPEVDDRRRVDMA